MRYRAKASISVPAINRGEPNLVALPSADVDALLEAPNATNHRQPKNAASGKSPPTQTPTTTRRRSESAVPAM